MAIYACLLVSTFTQIWLGYREYQSYMGSSFEEYFNSNQNMIDFFAISGTIIYNILRAAMPTGTYLSAGTTEYDI